MLKLQRYVLVLQVVVEGAFAPVLPITAVVVAREDQDEPVFLCMLAGVVNYL